MKIHSDIFDFIDSYDAFLIDVYGVLFNGVRLYEKTLETLSELKKLGKTVIILSNTTELSNQAQIGYSRRGLIKDTHYDQFVTSGEFVHQSISQSTDVLVQASGQSMNTVKCLFMGNGEIFQNTAVRKVDDIDDADFLYVGVPRSNTAICLDDVIDENGNYVDIEHILDVDWHTTTSSHGFCGLQEIVHNLEVCLERKKVLLVANPDIFAYSGINGVSHPILTQGGVGYYYEKMGGKVVYFGKPYKGIFDFAKSFVPKDRRIAMIGDTPWTDVCGANNADLDSILVTTGIPSAFAINMKDVQESEMDYLINSISPRMNHSHMSNVVPTHVIRRFARI
jgi:HAD superfamily hydrolase (TIGR01450 family)